MDAPKRSAMSDDTAGQAKKLHAMHDAMAKIGAADLLSAAHMIRNSDWSDLFKEKV